MVNSLPDTLWTHSVATAVFAREISRNLGKTPNDVAFVCGLMSRVGQLALLSCEAESFEKVLSQTDSILPEHSDEIAEMGLGHHQVGQLLLNKWGMPEEIFQVIGHWVEDDFIQLKENVPEIHLSTVLRHSDCRHLPWFALRDGQVAVFAAT